MQLLTTKLNSTQLNKATMNSIWQEKNMKHKIKRFEKLFKPFFCPFQALHVVLKWNFKYYQSFVLDDKNVPATHSHHIIQIRPVQQFPKLAVGRLYTAHSWLFLRLAQFFVRILFFFLTFNKFNEEHRKIIISHPLKLTVARSLCEYNGRFHKQKFFTSNTQ